MHIHAQIVPILWKKYAYEVNSIHNYLAIWLLLFYFVIAEYNPIRKQIRWIIMSDISVNSIAHTAPIFFTFMHRVYFFFFISSFSLHVTCYNQADISSPRILSLNAMLFRVLNFGGSPLPFTCILWTFSIYIHMHWFKNLAKCIACSERRSKHFFANFLTLFAA